MKFYKKYVSPRYWLAFLRRQPEHMQHMYAIAISGIITSALAATILYVDYGFWHDRYSRSETTATDLEIKAQPEVRTVSPGNMLGDFFKEASVRVQALKDLKTTSLDGKEVYLKEASTTKSEEIME